MSSDRRRIVVSEPEAVTERALSRAAERQNGRVLPKVRIADALHIERSGLDRAEYGYALQAHFDLLVVNSREVAQFAVEFDGAAHDSDPDTIARDQMKDAICDRLGFPLIRVDRGGWQRAGRFQLVEWLAEVWFYQRAFYEAQERGEVPWDEPFCYGSVFEFADGGGLRPAFAFDSEARLAMQAACRAGLAPHPAPEVIQTPFGHPGPYSEAWCVFALSGDRYVAGRSRLRNFRPFGVGASEIAEDLALAHAGRQLHAVRQGLAEPVGRDWVLLLRRRTDEWRRTGMMLPEGR